MVSTGFSNAFTSGEIGDDAWDRTDLQPVAKGCEEATNYTIRIVGPLGKRRGFWNNGAIAAPAIQSRLVPFRKSIDDALLLEFSNFIVYVWNNDGTPLMSGGVQVSFPGPYSTAQLPGLRYKQIGDVIYFRHHDGIRGETLVRNSNTSWTFTSVGIGHEFYPNGPWLDENTDTTSTVTTTLLSGTQYLDANTDTGNGCILVNAVVDLVATQPIFNGLHVGGKFRLRQTDGMPGVIAWHPGMLPAVGTFCVSAGRVYKSLHKGGFTENVTNPPINQSVSQNDGGNVWEYEHDGAGVVRIDIFISTTHVQGTVRRTLPFPSGDITPYWSEGAWSDFRGWPRMWPALREERMVEGATASNLDFLDLTETAGFSPISEFFPPGLGSTGEVVATDAVRRRIGTEGSELIWAIEATYLLVGTTDSEHLIAGSVLDEPIDPRSVTVKNLSDYGSADAAPVKAHKGAIWIARGGQNLREMSIDTQQGETDQDLAVLAQHIATRGMAQLAWLAYPDNQLWIRLSDGGLAIMVYHKNEQVRGFCRVALPPGFICEDLVKLPGPGRRETVWILVSRVKGGVTQRFLWMLSAPADNLFMDGAFLYAGAPATVIGNLASYNTETVRIVADGVQVPDQAVAANQVTLKTAASRVMVGFPMKCRFKSLKLDTQLGGQLNQRQRVVGCTVSLKTAFASVHLDGQATGETVDGRTAQDYPAAPAKRCIQNVALLGDTLRDPRIVIEDETAADGAIYSLKPEVAAGG